MIIGDVAFDAEIAHTSEQRSKGLSSRESLAPQTGMLFVFKTDARYGFWMVGMRFPLDFVWIGPDCAVVDITRNVPNPAPGTSSSELEVYQPGAPAKYNLEINAGEAEQMGIEAGAPVRFEGIDAANAEC